MPTIFRIRDPETGLWLNGPIGRPTFKMKTKLSWNSRDRAKLACTSYFVHKAGPAEHFSDLPATLEIVKFEVIETETDSTLLDVRLDRFANVLGRFDALIIESQRHRWENILRDFIRASQNKKTAYRYYARLPWDHDRSSSFIAAQLEGSCIPHENVCHDEYCIALKTENDLVAARMLMPLELIYDADEGKFLGV